LKQAQNSLGRSIWFKNHSIRFAGDDGAGAGWEESSEETSQNRTFWLVHLKIDVNGLIRLAVGVCICINLIISFAKAIQFKYFQSFTSLILCISDCFIS